MDSDAFSWIQKGSVVKTRLLDSIQCIQWVLERRLTERLVETKMAIVNHILVWNMGVLGAPVESTFSV